MPAAAFSPIDCPSWYNHWDIDFFFARASSENLSMQTASLKKIPAIQDKLLSPPFNPSAAGKPLPGTCSSSTYLGITAPQGQGQTHEAHGSSPRPVSPGAVGEGDTPGLICEESARLLCAHRLRGAAPRDGVWGRPPPQPPACPLPLTHRHAEGQTRPWLCRLRHRAHLETQCPRPPSPRRKSFAPTSAGGAAAMRRGSRRAGGFSLPALPSTGQSVRRALPTLTCTGGSRCW